MKHIEELGFEKNEFGNYYKRIGPFYMDISTGHENEMYVRMDGIVPTIYLQLDTQSDLQEAVKFFENLAEKMKP